MYIKLRQKTNIDLSLSTYNTSQNQSWFSWKANAHLMMLHVHSAK